MVKVVAVLRWKEHAFPVSQKVSNTLLCFSCNSIFIIFYNLKLFFTSPLPLPPELFFFSFYLSISPFGFLNSCFSMPFRLLMSLHLALLHGGRMFLKHFYLEQQFFAVTLEIFCHLSHAFYSWVSNHFTLYLPLDPSCFQEIHYNILDALVRGKRYLYSQWEHVLSITNFSFYFYTMYNAKAHF